MSVLARVVMVGLIVALVACAEEEPGQPVAEGDAPQGDVCADVDLSTPPDEPTTIRFGHGVAAEEQVWLQFAAPDVAGAEHYGTWYTVEAQALNAPERLAAYQAGQLEAGTIGTTELVDAALQDLGLAAVASIVREAEGWFNTSFVAMEDSGVQGTEDLEGARIGIVAPNSNTDYWARSAVSRAGLDPDRDVTYIAVPFPTQEEALRRGEIDVAVLVQPFASMAQEQGGIVEVFNALTGPGIDQELLVVWFDQAFMQENQEVYCAWRDDYVAATESYLDDRETAAAALIEHGSLGASSLEAYLAQEDWMRPPDGAIDLERLDQLLENMVETGFREEDEIVPAEDMVLPGYSLTN